MNKNALFGVFNASCAVSPAATHSIFKRIFPAGGGPHGVFRMGLVPERCEVMRLPSGKWQFSIAMLVYQRVCWLIIFVTIVTSNMGKNLTKIDHGSPFHSYYSWVRSRNSLIVMWEKQCHKPPMTGNGFYIPPIKMVMAGGWLIVLPTLLFLPGWWFGTMEFHYFPETVGNVIIPTDFHSIIFQRGRSTSNQYYYDNHPLMGYLNYHQIPSYMVTNFTVFLKPWNVVKCHAP